MHVQKYKKKTINMQFYYWKANELLILKRPLKSFKPLFIWLKIKILFMNLSIFFVDILAINNFSWCTRLFTSFLFLYCHSCIANVKPHIVLIFFIWITYLFSFQFLIESDKLGKWTQSKSVHPRRNLHL